MGLFGGDSSSSQQTNIRTENIGADQGSIAASYSTVNVLDAGAVQGALDFGQESLIGALNASAAQNAQAFDFAGGALGTLNASLNSAIDKSFQFARDSLGFVTEANRSTLASSDRALGAALDQTSAALATKDAATTGGSERLLIFGGLAVAALVLVAYFNR